MDGWVRWRMERVSSEWRGGAASGTEGQMGRAADDIVELWVEEVRHQVEG